MEATAEQHQSEQLLALLQSIIQQQEQKIERQGADRAEERTRKPEPKDHPFLLKNLLQDVQNGNKPIIETAKVPATVAAAAAAAAATNRAEASDEDDSTRAALITSHDSQPPLDLVDFLRSYSGGGAAHSIPLFGLPPPPLPQDLPTRWPASLPVPPPIPGSGTSLGALSAFVKSCAEAQFSAGRLPHFPPQPTITSTAETAAGVQSNSHAAATKKSKSSRKSAASNGKNGAESGKPSRPKRGQYRRYNKAALEQAVQAVRNGELSVHRAGSLFGVPHSTLEYKVKERTVPIKPTVPPTSTVETTAPSSSSSSSSSSSLSSSDLPPADSCLDKQPTSSSAADRLTLPPPPPLTSPDFAAAAATAVAAASMQSVEAALFQLSATLATAAATQ